MKFSEQLDSIRLMLTLHGIILEKILVELKKQNASCTGRPVHDASERATIEEAQEAL